MFVTVKTEAKKTCFAEVSDVKLVIKITRIALQKRTMMTTFRSIIAPTASFLSRI